MVWRLANETVRVRLVSGIENRGEDSFLPRLDRPQQVGLPWISDRVARRHTCAPRVFESRRVCSGSLNSLFDPLHVMAGILLHY